MTQEKEKHRSGLYYVIPAKIMDSEELEPLAKLLYALLSGLSDQEGKCFPSDQYLSKRLHVSERQCQDLLKQLEKHELVERHTSRCPSNPFRRTRTIKVNVEFKKPIQKNNCASPYDSGPAQMCESDGNAHANIESEAVLESEEVVCIVTPVGAQSQTSSFEEVVKKHFDGHEIRISLEKVFSEAVVNKKNWTSEEIREAWNILKNHTGPIRDPIDYINGTIKNFRNQKKCDYINKNGEKKCKNPMIKQSDESNGSLSAKDSKEQASLLSLLEKDPRKW